MILLPLNQYLFFFSYIWPSANYGHQYGGPYSWSKSHTPKAATEKASKAKTSKRHQTTKKSSMYLFTNVFKTF